MRTCALYNLVIQVKSDFPRVEFILSLIKRFRNVPGKLGIRRLERMRVSIVDSFLSSA